MQKVKRVTLAFALGQAVLTSYSTVLSSQEQPRSAPKAEDLTKAQFEAQMLI